MNEYVDAWLLPFEVLLRKTVHPDRLEEVADMLERLSGTDDATTNTERSAAARAVRQLADAARVALKELEDAGFRYDFENRRAVLRSERRGPPVRLVTIVVGSIFDGLDTEAWYTASTYDRVRRALAHLLDPSELSDDFIRGCIQRYVAVTRR